jgi:hypothetical protein
MKVILLPFLFLVFTFQLFSQTELWMVPIVANDINLRQPNAVVLDSITFDCTTPGKVLVRFDGNCTSTPGDKIILAASDFRNWRANDGNTSVMVQDPNYLLTCFDHEVVFIAEAGVHTFYAVAQNYAGTAGTGIASINGNFTLLFVPDTLTGQALSGKGIVDCCWTWEDYIHVFPSTSIETSTTGKLVVNFQSWMDMPFGSFQIYTTNLEPTWPAEPVETIVAIPSDFNYGFTMHSEIFPVSAGNYSVYGLAKFLTGDELSTNVNLYGNLSAQFVPDDNPDIQLKSQPYDVHLNATDGPISLGQLQFTNTQEGKAWLRLTGSRYSAMPDRIKIWMVPSSEPDSILSEILLQPFLETGPAFNFSLSGMQVVPPGTHTYDVMVDDASSGTFEGDIQGTFTLQFIANPIPSKVNDLTQDDSFSVFPNPTSGKVYVSSTRIDHHNPVEITILNSSGQQINYQTVSDLTQYSIDLGGLPAGEYMIQIKQGNLMGVRSVMKTK